MKDNNANDNDNDSIEGIEVAFDFLDDDGLGLERIDESEGGDDESSDEEREAADLEEELEQKERDRREALDKAAIEMERMRTIMEKTKLGTATTNDTVLLTKCSSEVSGYSSHLEDLESGTEKLKMRLHHCRLKRKKKLEKIDLALKQIEEAKNVDVAFVIDATSSMDPHIAGVKKTIEKIVDSIKETHEGASVRLAVVAYRDICDGARKRVQKLDFVASVKYFKDYLGKVKATGGGDAPEDMAIGVQTANGLSWKNLTRVVFIVADCPCHGTEFHTFEDDHPNGTPHISIVSELSWLLQNTGDGTMNVYFGRVTSFVDKMLERLEYKYNINLKVQDFSSAKAITNSVSRSIRNSIFNTVTLTGSQHLSLSYKSGDAALKHAKLKKFKVNLECPSSMVNGWGDVTAVKIYRNLSIKSIASLQAPLPVGVVSNSSYILSFLNNICESTIYLRRAHQPFAEGGSRLAYHAQIANKKDDLDLKKSAAVLKTFKFHGRGINDKRQYFKQMETSTIARFLAEEYNKSSFRLKHCAEIKMLQAAVIEEIDDANEKDGERCFCAEAPLPTDGSIFTRFSSNTGHWNMDAIDESLLRFTEFTYIASKRYLMVTDLQGVRVGNKFFLTDPAILCTDLRRFGRTNLGYVAMEKSLKSVDALMIQNGWRDAVDKSTAAAKESTIPAKVY